MTTPTITLPEQVRVATATALLNAASLVARWADDPLAQLDGGIASEPERMSLLHRMRSGGPLARSRLGVYVTATHAGCHAVFTSPSASSVPITPSGWVGRLLDPTVRAGHGEPFDESFISMDAPDHTRLRRLVQRGFTPKAIAAHQLLIEQVAADLADATAGRRVVDLVDDFARPLPMRVITTLIGVPSDDVVMFERWGDVLVTALDRPRSLREAVALHETLAEMDRWFRALVAQRRREPGDDLVSVLAEAADGEALTDDELVSTLSLLLVAGFETTVNLIGTGTATLIAHRDQLAQLAADPAAHIATTVEEALRYECPVQYTFRRTTGPIEVAPGRVVPAGSEVVTVLATANRDPEVFEHPDRFDITRANARKHLAFVTGPHACLGGALARMEAATAWTTLLTAFPDVDRWRLNGEPVAGTSRIIRCYRHLPMCFV
jgi:cytochrome P450